MMGSQVGYQSHTLTEMSNRTQDSALDVRQALLQCGTSLSDLQVNVHTNATHTSTYLSAPEASAVGHRCCCKNLRPVLRCIHCRHLSTNCWANDAVPCPRLILSIAVPSNPWNTTAIHDAQRIAIRKGRSSLSRTAPGAQIFSGVTIRRAEREAFGTYA